MNDMTYSPQEIRQFEDSAAEAERGYTVDFLRSRPKVGRRAQIGEEPAVVVPVRLDPGRLALLDARAAAHHVTRSQLIRDAVDRELARA
jgi:hypothetical protein